MTISTRIGRILHEAKVRENFRSLCIIIVEVISNVFKS